MSERLDVTIITVPWNSEELIADQIRSVGLGCQTITHEQIVVDNGSVDRTCEIVKQDFPDVTLIRNEKNLGFAAANNIAAVRARGEYILFLNPDMRVLKGSLDTIVSWMHEHKDVGLVSCKLVDSHRNLNKEALPRRLPRLRDMLAMILKIPHVYEKVLDHYMMKDFNAEKEQEVDSVRGSFMLIRKEILDTLGFAFDPRYFIWFEDVDLCREVKKLGYRVMYTPTISCVDYVGQSFKKRNTLWKQKQFTKSMLTYFKKWEPWYVWMWLWLARPFGIMLAWIHDVMRKRHI